MKFQQFVELKAIEYGIKNILANTNDPTVVVPQLNIFADFLDKFSDKIPNVQPDEIEYFGEIEQLLPQLDKRQYPIVHRMQGMVAQINWKLAQ